MNAVGCDHTSGQPGGAGGSDVDEVEVSTVGPVVVMVDGAVVIDDSIAAVVLRRSAI
jgi:hypothetical protein